MNVDLPAPLAPSRPVAGASTTTVTPSRACTSPYRFDTPTASMAPAQRARPAAYRGAARRRGGRPYTPRAMAPSTPSHEVCGRHLGACTARGPATSSRRAWRATPTATCTCCRAAWRCRTWSARWRSPGGASRTPGACSTSAAGRDACWPTSPSATPAATCGASTSTRMPSPGPRPTSPAAPCARRRRCRRSTCRTGFDVVVANSVFTHLDETYQDAWLERAPAHHGSRGHPRAVGARRARVPSARGAAPAGRHRRARRRGGGAWTSAASSSGRTTASTPRSSPTSTTRPSTPSGTSTSTGGARFEIVAHLPRGLMDHQDYLVLRHPTPRASGPADPHAAVRCPRATSCADGRSRDASQRRCAAPTSARAASAAVRAPPRRRPRPVDPLASAGVSATLSRGAPARGLRLGWLREHGDLLRTLLRRELRAKYKGSALGVVWSYLHPLLMMGVYTLVFSVLWELRHPALPAGRADRA